MASKSIEPRRVLPAPLYTTDLGAAYVGDSLELLARLDGESIDLVMTSPPFALQRKKAYGNAEQNAYVDWRLAFCHDVRRVLKPSGSFVLDLGGAYEKGRPVRSLYNFRVLIRLCDELGFRLAEEFFWYNPAKLPSPIEPRWTPQNRPFVDGSKPAISGRPRLRVHAVGSVRQPPESSWL